jgi:hypothetical protein
VVTDGANREGAVIEARRLQRSFGDRLIAESIKDLQKAWMGHVDMVLQDEQFVSTVHQALAKQSQQSPPRSTGLPSRSRAALADPEKARFGSFGDSRADTMAVMPHCTAMIDCKTSSFSNEAELSAHSAALSEGRAPRFVMHSIRWFGSAKCST